MLNALKPDIKLSNIAWTQFHSKIHECYDNVYLLANTNDGVNFIIKHKLEVTYGYVYYPKKKLACRHAFLVSRETNMVVDLTLGADEKIPDLIYYPMISYNNLESYRHEVKEENNTSLFNALNRLEVSMRHYFYQQKIFTL